MRNLYRNRSTLLRKFFVNELRTISTSSCCCCRDMETSIEQRRDKDTSKSSCTRLAAESPEVESDFLAFESCNLVNLLTSMSWLRLLINNDKTINNKLKDSKSRR